MLLKDFINTWNGKQIDFDNFASFQCVDLAKKWNQELGYSPRYGNGNQWINNAGNDYTRIDYSPGLVPQEGDIVSWAGASPANVPYGHVAIATGQGDKTRFQTFDQNWSGNYCKLNWHSYQSVQGWIRPKNYVGGGVDMVDNNMLVRLYNGFFHRQPDESSLGYVGKPAADVILELIQSEEHRIVEGQWGSVPGLQNQINDLTNQVGAAKSQLDGANVRIVELETNNKNLTDQIDVLNTEVASLKKQLSEGAVVVPTPSQPLADISIGELINEVLKRLFKRG